MNLLENKFVSITLDESNGLAEAEWFAETASMNEEEYYTVFSKIGELYRKHKVKKWLGNTLNFLMPVSPKLQEWTATELTPMLIEAGLQKMAIVVPGDFIAGLSVQQSVDEMNTSNESNFETRYFDNVEEARKWLLK